MVNNMEWKMESHDPRVSTNYGMGEILIGGTEPGLAWRDATALYAKSQVKQFVERGNMSVSKKINGTASNHLEEHDFKSHEVSIVLLSCFANIKYF